MRLKVQWWFCAIALVFVVRPGKSDDWTHGAKRFLYIRVNYPDDSSEPISRADAESMLEKVAGFFRTNSYGALSLHSTVTPLLTLPRPKTSYFQPLTNGYWNWNRDLILSDARSVARDAGFNTDDYDLDAVRLNSPLWQSEANIGSKGFWLFDSVPRTVAHELGHNFGLHHANLWQGDLNGAGQNIEYGNRFDMMGNTSKLWDGHFSAFEKFTARWLAESNVVRVTSSGIYRVYAHDVPERVPGRVYSLRVHKPAPEWWNDRDYWIEKRSLFPEADQFHEGVSIYWSPWLMSNFGTHLLDTSPDFGESLPFGVRLSDPAAGIHIIPVRSAEDDTWADVAVIVGEPVLNQPAMQVLRESSGAPWAWYSAAPGARAPVRLEQTSDFRTWSPAAIFSTNRSELFFPLEPRRPAAFFRGVQ